MSSSQKGGSFERAFAKRLSEWWTADLPDGPDDTVFWRTSGSGSRATTRGKKGLTTYGSYGDISAVNAIGRPLLDVITWELKRGYSKHTIHDILDAPAKAADQQYEKWFEKADRDATAAGSVTWALVTQRDRRDPLVFTSADSQLMLDYFDGQILALATIYGLNHEIDVFTLDGFLSGLNKEAIRQRSKE